MQRMIILMTCTLMACSSDGTTGAMGDPGVAGLVGPQGPQGPAGPQGPQGLQGPAGVTGAQGPAGPQGATGAAGAQGPAGAQGATGPAGAQGPQGLQGAQGPQGLQGAQGPQGLRGAIGAQGPVGPQPIAFSASGVQLGVLLSAQPGSEMYVALSDGYTNVADGTIVSMARTKVWYVNNDCTGQAYAVESFGWEPIAQFLYVGYFNQIYTAAPARAFTTPTTVQSYSMGGAACTMQTVTYYLHQMTSAGPAVDPTGSTPWHVAFQ